MPTVTPHTLTKIASVSAVLSGLIFIGVQLGHPHLDATSVMTTEVIVRNTLKAVMAVLALTGITGMYLNQTSLVGRLGLIGYAVLSLCYLLILSVTLTAAFVLPKVAESNPGYVDSVLATVTGDTASQDIGGLSVVIVVQGIAYLGGGLLFGIALYRAGVLARWAAALLAVGGLITVALSAMPDSFYRLLALPNGIAMVGLGISLWSLSAPTDHERYSSTPTKVDAATNESSDIETDAHPFGYRSVNVRSMRH
jgi:hypothetical protein